MVELTDLYSRRVCGAGTARRQTRAGSTSVNPTITKNGANGSVLVLCDKPNVLTRAAHSDGFIAGAAVLQLELPLRKSSQIEAFRMNHADHRAGTAVLFIALLAGCAGGTSSAPPAGETTSLLPAAVTRAATTTASLSSCSVTATAQSSLNGSTIGQVSAVNAGTMWFETYTPFNGQQSILHLERYPSNGTVLQPFNTPVVDSFIKAFADNDIWIAAQPESGSLITLDHWNGSSWGQIPLKAPYTSNFQPTGLSALSTNDVWVSGNLQGSRNGRSIVQFAIAHWNGSTFSIVAISPYNDPGAGPILEISPTDVWAITYGVGGTEEADAVHWDGSHFAFHQLPLPPHPAIHTTNPVQIAATGAKNIWVVGTLNTATTVTGLIWRYNGQWQPYAYTPAGASATTIFQGVAPLDSQRTVITAPGSSSQHPATTYAYTGYVRFHAIPNTISEGFAGPDEMVPGTSSFWAPGYNSAGAAVQLVSCR